MLDRLDIPICFFDPCFPFGNSLIRRGLPVDCDRPVEVCSKKLFEHRYNARISLIVYDPREIKSNSKAAE
jgi:hypothetical protein